MNAPVPINADAQIERAVVRLVTGDGWSVEGAIEAALSHMRAAGSPPTANGIARAREAAREAERANRAAMIAQQEREGRERAAEARRLREEAARNAQLRGGGSLVPASFSLKEEPGLLGDLARWSVRYAFRPVAEFAPICALATLAPVFGRRFVTPTNAGLNLYMIALAQTGTGKEALIGAPVAALCAAKLDFLVGAGDFTSDSAIELALRHRPNFLAPIDEIGEFIGSAQHKNAAAHSRTIRKALLDLHGKSRPDARWTGKQKVEVDADKAGDPIYAPHLSLLGCSTLEGFFGALTEANLSDGLINRFLVVRGGRPGPHNLDPGRAAVPSDLAAALNAAYTSTSSGNIEAPKAREASARPTMKVVPWGEGGQSAWMETLAWQVAAEDEGRGGIVSRAAENCLKVATIRALARDGGEAAVTAEDVRVAWGIVRASIEVVEASARENMAGSEFEQCVQLMKRYIIEAGPDGIAWSKLLGKRGIAKHTKAMLDGALERLEARGVIFRPTIGTGPKGGRPGLRVTARQFTDPPGYFES